VKKLEQD